MVTAKYHLILVIAGISPVVSVTTIDRAGMGTVDVRRIGNATVIVTGLEMAVVATEIGSRIDGIEIGIRDESAVKIEIESESESETGIANVIGEVNATAIVVVIVVQIVKESASVVVTALNLQTPMPTPTIPPLNLKLAA